MVGSQMQSVVIDRNYRIMAQSPGWDTDRGAGDEVSRVSPSRGPGRDWHGPSPRSSVPVPWRTTGGFTCACIRPCRSSSSSPMDELVAHAPHRHAPALDHAGLCGQQPRAWAHGGGRRGGHGAAVRPGPDRIVLPLALWCALCLWAGAGLGYPGERHGMEAGEGRVCPKTERQDDPSGPDLWILSTEVPGPLLFQPRSNPGESSFGFVGAMAPNRVKPKLLR
ncbi:hypothetical protein VUR80DRAFT_328 [Thermomyces stellatus]